MAETYQFCMDVEVNDEEALIAAARAKMVADGVDPDDGEMDSRTALRWLLDPGVSPAGCEITDSVCE